jgi:hypothetical protein
VEELGRLHGPSTWGKRSSARGPSLTPSPRHSACLSCTRLTLYDTEDLGLGSSSDGTVVATERNTLLVGLDILEVGEGLGELESTDSSRGFTGVPYTSSAPAQVPRDARRLTECS